jgi:copper chaperone NosL
MTRTVVRWRWSIDGVALAVAAGMGVALLAGCRAPAEVLAPPEIRYGEDVCAECNMIISEPRFAAGLVAEVDGRTQTLAFDDIGDLLAYQVKHADLKVLRRYVHDYDTEAWLPAEQATYVKSGAIQSPMGHGLAAFTASARATAFAREAGGEVQTWDSLSRADGAGTQP